VSKPTDLVQGTLDLLILKVIASQPTHGWAIAQRISLISNDVLQVGQGSLYPALHKLEHQGWISSKWGESENGRRAKYYSLILAHKGRAERARRGGRAVGTAVGRHLTRRPERVIHVEPRQFCVLGARAR